MFVNLQVQRLAISHSVFNHTGPGAAIAPGSFIY